MPTTIIGAALLSTVIGTAISFAVTGLLGLLFPVKNQRPDSGPLSSNLAAGGPKRVIFGQVGVRAARLIANQRIGQTHHWVAAVADWPVDGFEGVMIRGEDVEIDAAGWVTSLPWGRDGAQTIRFQFWDGTQTEPLAELIAADLVEAGSIGLNTAIVWAEIHVPQNADWIRLFQGAVPDFVFRVRGARVYDPTDEAQLATDASTWTWAREAILIQAFHQVCLLGRARPVAEIDWGQVAALLPRHRAPVQSRRGDTAPRFCADGVWSCVDETHAAIEGRIGVAHAGGLIDMAASAADGAGSLQRFWTSDVDSGIAATILDGDIGAGGCTISDTATIDTRPNVVRLTFPNASRGWERYTLEVADAAAIAEDGVTRAATVSVDTVTQHAQAAMLALYELRRQRGGRTITGSFSPRLLPIRAEDHVAVRIDDLQLTGDERWRVQASGMNSSDYADLTLGLDDPAFHADAGDLEPQEIELAETPLLDSVLPDPTVVVTSGAAAAVAVAGVILPGVRVEVSGEADVYRVALVDVTYDNGVEEVTISGSIQLEGRAAGSITLGPLPANAAITWRVEVQDYQSAPAIVTGTHTVTGDVTPPGPPTSLLVNANFSQTLTCTATAPGDEDVAMLRFVAVPQGDPVPSFPAGVEATALCSVVQRVTASITGLSGGSPMSVYAAAIDSSGNVSTPAGPYNITVYEPGG